MAETQAKKFWTSNRAAGYPTALRLKSGDTWEPGASQRETELIRKTCDILAPEGRYAIIDFHSLKKNEVSKEIGEVEAFSPKKTADILKRAGLKSVEYGTWNFILFVGGDKPAPFSVGFVSGVK